MSCDLQLTEMAGTSSGHQCRHIMHRPAEPWHSRQALFCNDAGAPALRSSATSDSIQQERKATRQKNCKHQTLKKAQPRGTISTLLMCCASSTQTSMWRAIDRHYLFRLACGEPWLHCCLGSSAFAAPPLLGRCCLTRGGVAATGTKLMTGS